MLMTNIHLCILYYSELTSIPLWLKKLGTMQLLYVSPTKELMLPMGLFIYGFALQAFAITGLVLF